MCFWYIPLTAESAKYATFITAFGRYHFNQLPFGIAPAPEHFQRRMSLVLEGLPGIVSHINGVLLWGTIKSEHFGLEKL